MLQNYVGPPNSRRFPTFLSLDLTSLQGFPGFFHPLGA